MKHRFVVEYFICNIMIEHEKHPISMKDGITGYPQVYRFLKLKHHIHFLYFILKNSIVERVRYYIKYQIEILITTVLIIRKS